MHSSKILNIKTNINFWMIILLIGGTMNITAMIKNGGVMPVYYPENMIYSFQESSTHFKYEDFSEVNYWHLTDWIHLGDWVIISPGDILIVLGMIFFLINVCKFFFIYFTQKIDLKGGKKDGV